MSALEDFGRELAAKNKRLVAMLKTICDDIEQGVDPLDRRITRSYDEARALLAETDSE